MKILTNYGDVAAMTMEFTNLFINELSNDLPVYYTRISVNDAKNVFNIVMNI